MFIFLCCYLDKIKSVSHIFFRSLVQVKLLSYELNENSISCEIFFLLYFVILNIALLLNKINP
jgi:hypothetical protein